jgi:hypothetical protein
MKAIEVKAREFHRRTAWAMETARKGTSIVIISKGHPPLALRVGTPEDRQRSVVDWDSHFAWLHAQPVSAVNPVDEVRASEGR